MPEQLPGRERLDLIVKAARLLFGVRRKPGVDPLTGCHDAEGAAPKPVTMCSHCRKVRNAEGLWLKSQPSRLRSAKVSHGLCPDCIHELYPEDAAQILAEVVS